MTHAPARPTADYRDLTATMQAAIDKALKDADNAPPGDTYFDAMEYVALAAGIPLPASRDLAICDCLNHGCGCGTIFDTALPGLVITANSDPDHNLSRLQCQLCGHDHPRPITD
ncbi:hypothetical protein HUT11_35395 (plasmid) [Streptomyces seoulensis]|nr:hypothetical protein HUT11_35395 [Streptomyces seoulensis]